jgi:myo-inositol 2-dehydrogenase/D-chiro-inositol 1-dehydrogenase
MRVAIVGTGGVAIRHLGVLSQLNGCSVVGHMSASRERAEAQSLQWGGRAYDGVDHMLEREEPDAVWVCVTPDRHGAIEEALIERGVPFFVEKPLSNDVSTAERIAALLEGRRLVVGVGYKFRGLDTLARVRDMLEDHPAQLALGAWHDRTPAPDWWRDELRSGGQLVEQATHILDLARVLLGEPRVLSAALGHRARPSYPDWTAAQVTAALLVFRDDVPATLTATCLLDGPLTIRLQLVCEGRALTITERTLRVETGREVEEFPVTVDPFRVEDEGFLRAVADDNPGGVLCNYADALATHRVAFAILSAAVPRSTIRKSLNG